MASPEEKFDEALQLAEQAREKILASLQGISQLESERKPAPEAWCIGEIAHHLLLCELRFADQILNSIAEGRRGEYNQEEVLSKRPVSLEDTADVEKSGKGTAPAPTQPSHGLSIKDLRQDLRQACETTRARLLPHRSQDLSELWWSHPRFGPMTLYERISLMGHHDLKHLTQIENCKLAILKS